MRIKATEINAIMRRAIVLGGCHHNTLGVIRSLGYRGVYSELILIGAYVNPYITFSRFLSSVVYCKNEEEAIMMLIKQKKDKYGSVVFACSDGASSALDLHMEELKDYYRIPGCKEQGRLTSFMNKEVMSELGRKVGFNVPKSCVVDSQVLNPNIQYPCIIKPIISKNGTKTDIRICNNKEQLVDAFSKGSCSRYQVQNFIKKDFEYQLIGVSIDGGSKIIIPGLSRCIRPCPGTNTGYLHYEALDKLSPPPKTMRGICK